MSFDEEIRLLPEVLKQLNMKEEYVIRYYFGLGGAKACTLKEIGEMFGHDCPESRELGMGRSVSRARIGQIKDATIVKARALIEHFGSTGAWPVMSDSPLKLCSEW